MSNKGKYIQKAHKFYSDKKFEDAIYWYSRAVAEDDRDPDLYSERAVAYFHNKQLKESLADMDRSQELEPKNAYRYSSRAYIKDAMGDVNGAVEDYRVAVKLDPEDAIAHNNLGMLEEKLGYHNKAKTLLNFADDLAKNDPGHASGSDGDAPKQPENIQREIDQKKSDGSLMGEMGKVFGSKKGFKEFVGFVKNGFK
jgi:tetratricopeptide (TPR) repeat protein